MQFLMSGSIFQTTTLCQEGEKTHLNVAIFALAKGEPGPPVEQASALSIRPLPLGSLKTLCRLHTSSSSFYASGPAE